jgi:hypothetical protein
VTGATIFEGWASLLVTNGVEVSGQAIFRENLLCRHHRLLGAGYVVAAVKFGAIKVEPARIAETQRLFVELAI